MTFRVRTLVVLVGAALIPLLLFGFGVRSEMSSRLTDQLQGQLLSLTRVVSNALTTDQLAVKSRLGALARSLEADGRFRAAIAGDDAQRGWLLDWAEPAMRLAGLDFLEVLDSTGRIVSSGHFRNDFDRPEGTLAATIQSATGHRVLVETRLAEGNLMAMVMAESFTVGGRRFSVIGGRALSPERVAAFALGGDLSVALLTDSVLRGPATELVRMPHVDLIRGGPASIAKIVAIEDRDLKQALLRRLDRWLLVAVATVGALAVLAAGWLGRQLSGPVVDLAQRTAQIDLDGSNPELPVDREDEIGVLARSLDQMTRRLRSAATRLRDTERRAAVGDVARQINHDVKNGLAPIRHVIRHLTQTVERDPAALVATYAERRGTLESSIDYLDQLARQYAKLSPPSGGALGDPNQVAAQVTGALSAPGLVAESRLAPSVPLVAADAVILRRILENLTTNAVEALGGQPGRVTVTTAVVGEGAARRVRLMVTDTGPGIPAAEQARVFEDFYTTKPAGSGLGLSVVRRLLADVGGTLRLESVPGQGTTFIAEMPPA